MKINDLHIYQADATVTKPLCVVAADGSWSVTIWLDKNDKVSGALYHEYKDDMVVKTWGEGLIPAEYVAVEENARI